MSRLLVLAGILIWVGAAMLLSNWRRLSRPPLSERLRPYRPGPDEPIRPAAVSVDSLRDVIGPIARGLGDRVAALFGVSDELGVRLRRVHSPLDVTAFRIRQLLWSGAGLIVGMAAAFAGVPTLLTLTLLIGLPLLAFLSLEQRLATASKRWQEQVSRELPVLSEQLAMLLNAGYSLGAALNRLAARSHGASSRDLLDVTNRIRQGLTETDALREWSAVAQVPALERLVSILALNTEASDLGRLVSAEARQARRERHRRLSEIIDRRAEQVWVPVTVATLVPGVILLAIPFLAALRLFSSA